MPYRRLPNTDSSRLRAMKLAYDKGKEMPSNMLAFSAKTLLRLERSLPQFEKSINLYRESVLLQSRKNKDYYETIRKSRMYLTHFIKVMNMAIYRGELPSETRAFYGLATDDSSVPMLGTENELLSWGRRIIEGEEYRIKKAGSPITNPTIAVVKVRFGSFLDALNNNKILMQKAQEFSIKIAQMRKEADDIILNIWNEVENSFSQLPEERKKEMCESFGLVYFYRKNELPKTEIKNEVSSKVTSI